MPTIVTSPSSLSTRSLQDMFSDAAPVSPARSPCTATLIAIAVKAHEKMRHEPFAYAFNHLLQRENCKVVVICCLSRVQSELGHILMIDNSFGGISKKKLLDSIDEQTKNLNHYLKAFRERLDRKGIQLEIRISVGRKSEDILVQEAKALHPLWVVLDSSWATFSGNQHRTVQAALQECNLVLIKNSKPLIVHQTTNPSQPVQESHDQVQAEVPVSNTSSPILRNFSSSPITSTATSAVTCSLNPEITSIVTTEAPSSTQSSPTITGENASSNGTTPAITPETSSSNETTLGVDAQETSSSNGAPEMSSSNRTTPIATAEVSSSNGTTPTATAELSSSNGTTPTATAELSSSNGTTPTATAELSTWNGTTSTATADISTSSGAPEMSSSNGPNPTTTAESFSSSTSNGTSSTRTTDMSVRDPGTERAAPSNNYSNSDNGTSAEAFNPAWTPKQAAKPRSLKDIYIRVTSQTPVSPKLVIPLNNSPSSSSTTSTSDRQANGTSKSGPITQSPSHSWRSTGYLIQSSQVKKASKLLSDSGRPTVPQIHNTSIPQSEDTSFEVALAIAMEASIHSAMQEGIPLSPRSGGASMGPYHSTYSNPVRETYNDLGPGFSAGLGTFPEDTVHRPGSAQLTPSLSPGLASNSSEYFAPSAPPLPLEGPIQYPSVDTSPVQVNYVYPGEPRHSPAEQRQKSEATSRGGCIICLDAPADAVCIPCGHIACCKNCLMDTKKWGCLICRAKVEQVFKVYHAI